MIHLFENNEIEDSTANAFIKKFRTKNLLVIQNFELGAEMKQKKIESIDEGSFKINLFYRTKSLEDFKNK